MRKYFQIFLYRLWSKRKYKKKSKIRRSEKQIQQIIDMAKQELEVRRISNIIDVMTIEYYNINLYIESLWFETITLEKFLINENIKRCNEFHK